MPIFKTDSELIWGSVKNVRLSEGPEGIVLEQGIPVQAACRRPPVLLIPSRG